jgi:Tfp pilus assembly protein PilO
MAVMSDFAQLPGRQKVMLFVLIGAVLGVVYYQFGYKKLVATLQTAQVEHDGNIATNAKLEKDIVAFAKLKTRMTNLTRIIEENETALPTESELPAFFEMLNRKVLESGVEVVQVTQREEVPVETFVKVPISYEIQGSFLQIKKFFASLIPKKKHADSGQPGDSQETAEKERIVSIENLSLTNPVVRNHEIKLTAKFVASTYRQEDAQPSATPKKPAAATPPATTPGTKAAPPTNTPAGAKAATEKALDKADTRSQKANGVDETSGSAKMKAGVP